MQIRRVAAVYAGLVIAATALHLWYTPASSAAVIVIGLASAGAIAYGVRRYQPARATAWWLLASAVLVNAIARVVYDMLPGDAGTLKPWAWIVWALHLAMLVLLIAGALGLARSTLRGASAAIDAAIIVLGSGLIGGILIAIPYANVPGVGDLWRSVRVAYVFRDVVVLAIGDSPRYRGAMEPVGQVAPCRPVRARRLRRPVPAGTHSRRVVGRHVR